MMRILMALFMLAIMAMPAGTQTASNPQGHIYMGTPGAQRLTVAQAKSLPDDTYVSLTGNLVAKGEKDLYTFRDASGEIAARIDSDLFSGMSVGPGDTVRITGELDMKNGKEILIDVKHLEIPDKQS